jgi:hypothetical protein
MVEWKVTLDNLLTFAGLILTFAGLIFVALQMREENRQRKIESQIRMHDINRELISMGFDKPELFEILKGTNQTTSEFERRFLQLWLNQLSMFHSLKEAGDMQKEFEESCDRDLRNMFEKANMRRHWEGVGKFYPASFQKAVNAIIAETGYETTAEAAERPTS